MKLATMTLPLRIMALAARSGRIAMVFLVSGELKDWETSRKGAKKPSSAAVVTERWMKKLKPQVIVVEKLDGSSRKSDATKAITRSMAETAKCSAVILVSVKPPREYANMYEEATALAERYPEITPWLPEYRKFYKPEPRVVVLFEALLLADTVRRDAAIRIAAAME